MPLICPRLHGNERCSRFASVTGCIGTRCALILLSDEAGEGGFDQGGRRPELGDHERAKSCGLTTMFRLAYVVASSLGCETGRRTVVWFRIAGAAAQPVGSLRPLATEAAQWLFSLGPTHNRAPPAQPAYGRRRTSARGPVGELPGVADGRARRGWLFRRANTIL